MATILCGSKITKVSFIFGFSFVIIDYAKIVLEHNGRGVWHLLLVDVLGLNEGMLCGEIFMV